MIVHRAFLGMLVLLGAPCPAGEVTANAPVYFHLFLRATDHVNFDLTEQRIQRYLPMVEQYRRKLPQSGISLLCQFSGTASEQLAARNRGSRIVDLVLEARRKGVVETGYDGAEEPTPCVRPQPNFRRARTPEHRWMARLEAAEWFLTEYKHFLNGEPDPDRSGGLKRMLEVFGEAAFIAGATTGLGGDPEVVHHLRRFSTPALMSGLPERETLPARNIEGYRGGSHSFGELMSPQPECAPEVFWQNGVLRLSDTSGEAVKILRADAGPEELKKALAGLDRTRLHVIRVELGRPGIYLRPQFEKDNPSPLQYAYANPKLPRLPPDALRTPEEIDAAFGREDASIQWLAGEFLPANPGSRFVSSADLLRMTPHTAGAGISRDKLRRATESLVERWKIVGNHPPEYVPAGDEYLSLADMFQLLASALAVWHEKSTLPDSVLLRNVYGPLQLPDDQGPSTGSVSVAGIARTCAGLVSGLNDVTWRPLPNNVIPGRVDVEGTRLNAAQFLRLMAEAFLSPSTAEPLRVKTCQMYHGPGMVLPTTRRLEESGATWTIKPARLISR
jgi:hypothetical protein